MQRVRNNVEILGAEQMKFHKFNPEKECLFLYLLFS
jgi:hypothetical protein